ncbi:agarase [Lacibacter sediminis]|uniref:Agarase n=1 Tax=Lacibacter sediminis TaxID=2760713 RepID=A0A7G5XKH1_9BACT|nr:agarase [Lacibacter sediminis]QNA45974.1 agarase [Lacibacter sediminis]
MMTCRINTSKLILVAVCLLLQLSTKLIAQASAEYTLKVESMVANSEKKVYGQWKWYPTRSIQTLNSFQPKANVKLNQYGARTDMKLKATGFFRAEKVKGRWWIVDPTGHPMINIALNNVATAASDSSRELMMKQFGSKEKWAAATKQQMIDLGYNALGAWSDNESFQKLSDQQQKPFSYTIIKGFMSDYGRKKGQTYQLPGHTGYPDNTIFVFDPEFEAFCDEYAKQLAANKNDKNLFGYFSDNEMPFQRLSLDRYLAKKDSTDHGCVAAKKWLQEKGLTIAQITDKERHEFLGVMADRYYSIVSKAIKKYDPNHLYLGSRFHSYEKKVAEVFQAAGKYVDVIAVNYYREWTPLQEDVVNWEKWSGRPFIITEWYTKGEDSGMPNYSGAGWIVRTQKDRGLFYQNFTLALLESKNCVGFHWFKYQDNDPSNLKTDPSNRDANKGIVTLGYSLYSDLTEKMKELNTNVYQLIDFFDQRNQ